jgi:hypothetical protein
MKNLIKNVQNISEFEQNRGSPKKVQNIVKQIIKFIYLLIGHPLC